MIVHLSYEAIADLERIADYIAQNNSRRALSFVQELRDKCLSLGNMPQAYPLVPRYEKYGVRRRVHGNYLIFYRIDAGQVTVLHILNSAMDYTMILFPDE